jgi:prevent-host-death family protein
MKTRVINATEFKAKCLAILDQIHNTGGTVTVTKRGRPVAILGPAEKDSWKSPAGAWVGKVQIVGDIVNVDTSDLWDVIRQK